MSRAPILLILHERKAYWAGHLRPRLADRPVRVIESRSIEDLRSALGGGGRPILLIDLADGLERGLEATAEAALIDPDALILALSPGDPAEVGEIGDSDFPHATTRPTAATLRNRRSFFGISGLTSFK